MLQKWHEHGAITCAGYIIGFPGDTKESILRDIEIIKRELPLDVLELFMLTPLPGSEDHKILWQQGAWMDPDLNKYDLNNRVTHHPVEQRFPFAVAREVVVGDEETLDALRVVLTNDLLDVVSRAVAAFSPLDIDDRAERALVGATAAEITAR